MKKIIIILLALSAFVSLQAQSRGKGDIPESVYYLMPSFAKGTIFFRGQMPADGTLNICAVDNSLRYIDKDGQEMSAVNADNIVKVKIDTVVFMRREGVYYRMYPVTADMSLALHRRVHIIRDAKRAGYDGTSHTSAIQSYGTLYANGNQYNLMEDKKYPWDASEELFVYNGETLVPVSKHSIRKLFPSKKAEIDAWFKAGNTLPKKPEELVPLLKNWAE